jgi:hypothetical protein
VIFFLSAVTFSRFESLMQTPKDTNLRYKLQHGEYRGGSPIF